MVKSSFFLIFLALFCSTLFAAIPKPGPTGLMVEFLRNPSLGSVNTSVPNFSWIVNGSGKELQQQYQILVATSAKKLEAGVGEVWNSGMVTSNESVNIKYGGLPLKSTTTYYWRVTIWKSQKRRALISEIQEFKTGTFEKGYETSVMPLVQHAIRPQTVIAPNSRKNYFADFGKAVFGTLKIQIESKNPDSVIVHLGEKLASAGLINRDPGGTIRYRRIAVPVDKGTKWYTINIPHIPRNSKYPAIVMPAEVGEVTPFRYCEIENRASATECKSVEQIAVNYYWDDSESSFTSSDTILNQVWDLCKYSIKATTFCGIYVDGDRERIPYEADAYIDQLGHYCTDREYSMARNSQEYLIFNPTWPTEWIMHSVMMAWADYLYTGDSRSLATYYKDLKFKTLISLAREDGLISTISGLLNESVLNTIHIKSLIKDNIDWPRVERDGNEMPAVNTVINAFHYESLQLMSRIAMTLGYTEDELFFRKRGEMVKAAINRQLFDPAKKIYTDGEGSSHSSLHANIFPLAFGVVPANSVKDVAKFITSKGMACSVYAAQFLLESLYAAGEDKVALDLMRSTNERSWWNMVRSGSTITLEAWDYKFKPNLDWNHAWGAVPANMVTRGLWGIVPVTPGFGVTQIKPQTGGLTSSSIKVPTIRGSVNCEFKTDNVSRFDLQVSIPSNMKAVISIPVRDIVHPELFVEGKKIDGKREGKFFVAETGGGEVHFSVREERKVKSE